MKTTLKTVYTGHLERTATRLKALIEYAPRDPEAIAIALLGRQWMGSDGTSHPPLGGHFQRYAENLGLLTLSNLGKQPGWSEFADNLFYKLGFRKSRPPKPAETATEAPPLAPSKNTEKRAGTIHFSAPYSQAWRRKLTARGLIH